MQRDRHAAFIGALALCASTCEKIAVELRHLARTEVREVQEEFGAGQKGSSAMPHKRNPWRLENVSGLARVMRGYASAALENQALWHERDISNSSVERVIFPDACVTLDFMLHRLAGLVETLVVFPERMRENLEMTRGLAFSGALLLALAAKNLTREDAYARVQKHAMDTWDHGGDFRERVLADPRDRARAREGGDRARVQPRRGAAPRRRDLRAHARARRIRRGELVKALVQVTLKPDVLDPQGKAIRSACASARLRARSRACARGSCSRSRSRRRRRPRRAGCSRSSRGSCSRIR